MSFINSENKGVSYNAGFFLANNEDCTRLTREISDELAVDADNGGKYVPAGTVYPANGSTAEGIVYEPVDVSNGNMPGSVVLSGTVYEDRLPDELSEEAKTALEAKGFVFVLEEAEDPEDDITGDGVEDEPVEDEPGEDEPGEESNGNTPEETE